MARSRNVKPIEKLDLISGEFAGYYLMDDGNLMEAHESVSNWFDEDELEGGPEPDGAVYYSTYVGAEEYDGGLMGYMAGETFASVIEFMAASNQPTPIMMIAKEGSMEYHAIEDALYEGDIDTARAIVEGLIGPSNKKRGYLR